jgi:hypothetical protein
VKGSDVSKSFKKYKLHASFFSETRAQIGSMPPRFEVSRSHTIIHMHDSVGLLWTSDQVVAKIDVVTES